MTRRTSPGLTAALALLLLFGAAAALASYIEQEPPAPAERSPAALPYRPPGPHVPELARYLERLNVLRPATYRQLAIYPVTLRGDALGGRWLAMDDALSRGLLLIAERAGEGSVPVIVAENRSREDHVFLMAGEVVSGGKQTRTLRQDVILAPGQRVDLHVLCVEARRWEGKPEFRSGGILVPQSVQKEVRRGADQDAVWGEVARSNAALGAETRTGSVEAGYKAPAVQEELDRYRKSLLPAVPRDSVGFLLVDRYRGVPVGAEFFGRPDLAMALLPKILDAYAVDFIVQRKAKEDTGAPLSDDLGRRFLDDIRRAGSFRSETLGSGAGIRTRNGGFVGEGVSLGDVLVHFGCQTEERFVPVTPPPPPPPPDRTSVVEGK